MVNIKITKKIFKKKKQNYNAVITSHQLEWASSENLQTKIYLILVQSSHPTLPDSP